MSIDEDLMQYQNYDFENYFNSVEEEDIRKILKKDKIDRMEYLALLSPKAENLLDEMGKKAQELSIENFGKEIKLYTPLYISNFCVNQCLYCSFNVKNDIKRGRLTLEEIENEAKEIAKTGLKHILVLTGESPTQSPVEYIIDAVKILKKYFTEIAIEVHPLSGEEYKKMIEAGVDGLTIYQEVYNKNVYDNVHITGPKKDYKYRIDAPERACKEKMKNINIGALLGLNDFREEAFFTGLHAEYLQKRYPDSNYSMSFPRIRPYKGENIEIKVLRDKNLIQVILAGKIFMPNLGINISTRESQEFRDSLIPLGVTKMSAGVNTEVGGRKSKEKGSSQFEISDERSVEDVKQAIINKGYVPIF